MGSSTLPIGLEDFDVRTESELPSLVSVRRFEPTIEGEKVTQRTSAVALNCNRAFRMSSVGDSGHIAEK